MAERPHGSPPGVPVAPEPWRAERSREMWKKRRTGDRARIEAAARALDPETRAVFMLSAARGLALEEVAGRLGIDITRAEALLADALRQLHDALERPRRPWWRP